MNVLSSIFLFHGMEREEILWKLALVKPKRESYHRGEVLCAPEAFRRALFVLLHGECDVIQHTGDSQVVLNSLHAGDTFGVVSLFSRRDVFPTTIVARKETEILILTRADVERMMNACPQISLNLILFLTDRVEFMNDRVASLTESTVERKVVGYLLSAMRENNSELFRLNRKHTAEKLHCGRASLYRTLDELTQNGLIACEGSSVRIMNREGLEKMLQ